MGRFFNMANKQSRTYQEQIDLLKSRGMCIHDEAHAIASLKHISYYRLKGYWWDMQADCINHIFKPDTDFITVLERYHFDKELRYILFDAIETIEISLRTQMIYQLSQSYGGLWYLDKSLFVDENYFESNCKKLRHEFNRSTEVFALEYKKKHTYTTPEGTKELDENPDAWIILEVASFGTLSKMYENLVDNLPEKAAIANELGLNFHNDLSSWLKAIAFLRNMVAHHSRLWNRHMVIKPSPAITPKYEWLSTAIESINIERPFLTISAMLYLCNCIDANNPFKAELKALFAKYPSLSLRALGFPTDWESNPLWK